MAEREQHEREQHDVGLVLARLLLGGLFIVMGYYKFGDITGVAEFLASQNLPAPTALAWLANVMNQRGTPLKAGSFISLGSVVKTVWIEEPGTEVVVSFKGLGEAVVLFE